MRKKIVWILLSIALVASIAIVNVSAPPPTYVYVDPELTWDPTKVSGQYSVDIKVSYIARRQSLWAYQIELSFNPAVLQGASYGNGPFMSSRGGTPVFVEGDGFDNTAGTLSLFGAYLDPIANFPYGMDGVLATVTFDVVGIGSSDIVIGPASQLTNALGAQIPIKDSQHGFFSNEPEGPELYIRRRGAHGGGVWPEWHVGLTTDDQTLTARIMNYGELGASVQVKFEVSVAGMPTQVIWSNEAVIDAATWVADDIVPGEVEVSATFPTGTPGDFTVNAKLYFKLDAVMRFYGDMIPPLDGEPVSRDIATKYKVT